MYSQLWLFYINILARISLHFSYLHLPRGTETAPAYIGNPTTKYLGHRRATSFFGFFRRPPLTTKLMRPVGNFILK
jgi:hypothetical protein